uniref:Uncharacterized protein n=1 Tax=Trichogramma kaykai TaxID=54128 RepID=A0ABD2VUB7_9HYME
MVSFIDVSISPIIRSSARSSSVPKRRLATRPMTGAKDLLWRSLECWLSVRRRFSTVFVASISCTSDIFSLVVYGQVLLHKYLILLSIS